MLPECEKRRGQMGKEFGDMKVVGFNTKEGLHLGVVEGEEVVDLQAVDASAPNDLGEWLRRSARF